MLVAGENASIPDAGNEERGVLHHVALLDVDAGMGERDHDVGALLLDLRHPGLGRFDDVARLDVAFQVLRPTTKICGGTKPMTPILIGCSAPLPS
jgi:hypothetical protein